MGIVGPQVYQSRFGPEYRVSYATSIVLLVGAVGMIAGTWWLVRRKGRKEEIAQESSRESAEEK